MIICLFFVVSDMSNSSSAVNQANSAEPASNENANVNNQEEEQQQNKEKKHDSGAADLEKVRTTLWITLYVFFMFS